jgi:hypothetical protein
MLSMNLKKPTTTLDTSSKTMAGSVLAVLSTADSTASQRTKQSKLPYENTNSCNTRLDRAVLTGRIVFILCLVVVARTLGYLSHYVLSQAEHTLAVSQFDSIAERALVAAQQKTERKRLGTISMASIASNMLCNDKDWPFVVDPGFEEMANNLINTSDGRKISFVPIIQPGELSTWEDFAYDYYEYTREPPFPNGTGVSSFGKGIWGVNRSLDSPGDRRYHDTNANSTYGSPYQIFTPILHQNFGPHRVIMLNIRYEPVHEEIHLIPLSLAPI